MDDLAVLGYGDGGQKVLEKCKKVALLGIAPRGVRIERTECRLRVELGRWRDKLTKVNRPKEPQLPRAERLVRALARDGANCVWCLRALPVGSCEASVDHLVPRLKGGPSWIENEVAACRRCNQARGHAAPLDWLRRCKEQGLEPAVEIIAERLQSLARAIEERGGQRKARPYLAGQLRRLEKWRESLFGAT